MDNQVREDLTSELFDSFETDEVDFIESNVNIIQNIIQRSMKKRIPVPFYLYKHEFAEFIVEERDSNKYHRISAFEIALKNRFIFENTEYSQVFYWDLLIRNSIQEYFDHYKINYNVNRNAQDKGTTVSTNGQNRNKPDFLLYCIDFLVFKGEEKATNLIKDKNEAINDLEEKECSFDADILLCYAAAGAYFQFFYLNKKEKKAKPLLEEFDLNSPLDRLKVVRVMFNICSLIKKEINNKIFKKILNNFEFKSREGTFLNETEVTKNIPNVYPNYKNYLKAWEFVKVNKSIHFIKVIELETCKKEKFFIIRMHKGELKRPKNEKELIKALKNILNGLSLLHSKNYAHNDLRWENIVYHYYNYRLVDFNKVIELDSNFQNTFQNDLKQVGKNLIKNSGLVLSEYLEQIAEYIDLERFNSAKCVLTALETLEAFLESTSLNDDTLMQIS